METLIRVAGVPEHFNYPFKLAGKGEKAHRFQWMEVPEGSGRMAELLEEDKVDCAIMLTESAVRAINRGLNARIRQYFVGSPLLWGVHIGYRAERPDNDSLSDYRVAISRLGSGSHLMAVLYARSKGWDPSRLEFIRVDSLDGALTHLAHDPHCLFLWEQFTTQPWVDARSFMRMETFPTPWPCFAWVCSTRALHEKGEVIWELLQHINGLTSNLKSRPDLSKEISLEYGLREQQVEQWLSYTQWSQAIPDAEELDRVQEALLELHLIDGKLPYCDLVFARP